MQPFGQDFVFFLPLFYSRRWVMVDEGEMERNIYMLLVFSVGKLPKFLKYL